MEKDSFGDVEVVPLTRIEKFAAGRLARNWATLAALRGNPRLNASLDEGGCGRRFGLTMAPSAGG